MMINAIMWREHAKKKKEKKQKKEKEKKKKNQRKDYLIVSHIIVYWDDVG